MEPLLYLGNSDSQHLSKYRQIKRLYVQVMLLY